MNGRKIIRITANVVLIFAIGVCLSLWFHEIQLSNSENQGVEQTINDENNEDEFYELPLYTMSVKTDDEETSDIINEHSAKTQKLYEEVPLAESYTDSDNKELFVSESQPEIMYWNSETYIFSDEDINSVGNNYLNDTDSDTPDFFEHEMDNVKILQNGNAEIKEMPLIVF